ncbi:mucoidy inhibitor MuiA family protein [Providencia stuartii]|uniref:mucoidy inhibitor MuiA family protein n=1 Tax=Providencia stuartii TaxID=588 RepID=UPI0011242B45
MPTVAKLVKGVALFSAFISLQSVANEIQSINKELKLNQATIFLRGAELNNSAELVLPAGQSQITLTNVAQNVNKQSLSMSFATDDIVIRSVNLQHVPTKPSYAADITALIKKINEIKNQIADININVKVNDEQLALLKDQRFFGESTALSLEQISSKLDFIRKQMASILSEQRVHEQNIQKLTEEMELLQTQLESKMPANADSQTEIVLTVDTPKSITTNMHVSYMTPDAGWSPSYDIRAKAIDKPLLLTYKADVIQNTGINWEQVKLSLSSTNPTRNIIPPALSPWYLSVYDEQMADISGGRMMMEMAPSAPAPIARMSAKKVNSGIADYVVTDTNGVNLSYNIELPYSLNSTPRSQSITIKQQDVDAKYRYTATPKLSEEVYLQAEVDNWQNLNLLNGPANIYLMNNYIGSYQVMTDQLTKTLDVPFGIDKNIQISRASNELLRKKPTFIGSMIEQKESYIIKVKNNRNNDINLVVYDQLPVSQDSEIKITDMEYENGNLDKTNGKIKWDLLLKPNQQTEIPLNYTLKYPKEKHIVGL